MAIKHFRGYKKAITALKLIPLVLIIYTCEERAFDNPFDPSAELNPDDWAPTNLTIDILSDSDVRLTWQNNKTNITVSKIERKPSRGGPFVEVGSSDTTIYTDTGLITGNEYLYQVCAYAGDQKSSYIPSDTIMTVFPAPYNFTAESLSSGIVLTWDDSTAFEEIFQVERKAISSNAYTILDSTQANTYLDSVIALGNHYIYRVSAFSNYNSTNYTETAVVKYWQDCLDVWGGDAEEDNCGTCDNDSSNDCNVDCAGVENGTAVEDCSGECGGTAVEDECGVCNGSGSPENYDCDGNCTTDIDCNGDCGGSAVEDECGVCDGDGTTCSATITDIDGNVYETVQIGEQLWMAENLKVTHYNNGDQIPTGHSGSDWTNLNSGAYAVYPYNNEIGNVSTCEGDCANVYGNLYNWYAVDDSRGVCPTGFRVPSDEEFMELEMFLGMSEEEANSSDSGGAFGSGNRGSDEGSKLAGKADLWNDGDLENNTEFGTSGFNVLPAGNRASNNGNYYTMGDAGYFWLSLAIDSDRAWRRQLYSNNSRVIRTSYLKLAGWSIRCVESEVDCAGVAGGSAVEDECGVCNGSGPPENYDCSGNCTANVDCNGDCGGSVVEDECGVCDGDGTTCSTTVTDIDGNVYQTVQIGEQLWMAENLKTTKYKDGSAISTGHSDSEWKNLSTGAYAVYNNNPSNADTYGNLYNWYTVDDSRSVCPEGWHVPADNEYTILIDYLGGEEVAGGKMKEAGTEHWNSPNTGATNESGFTALPGGYRGWSGSYHYPGERAFFWSSSENESEDYVNEARYRNLYKHNSNVSRESSLMRSGYSIRCIEGEVDCAGVPDGSATEDNCGTCDSDNSNDCVQDCNGDWGGNLVEDECGICGGNSVDADDDGICDNLQGTVIDIDGNTYKTIKIGTQNWMAENLKVTRYRDGKEIPNITDNYDWTHLTTGAYSNIGNTEEHIETYGRLYNWFAAVDSSKIAPEGWHIPSDDEWQSLIAYLGGSDYAGGKMKTTGTKEDGNGLWLWPNYGSTNESGFSALPSGYRGDLGNFGRLGGGGYFWTVNATTDSINNAWYYELDSNGPFISYESNAKINGYSIRCVKD